MKHELLGIRQLSETVIIENAQNIIGKVPTNCWGAWTG